MDTLRQSLFSEAQHGVAIITHKLFENGGLLVVTDAQKEAAKKIIADVLHGSRRKVEKAFCEEDQGEQVDGTGVGRA